MRGRSTISLPGRIFQFNVSINAARDHVDSSDVRKLLLEYMAETLHTAPEIKVLRDSKVKEAAHPPVNPL